MKIEKYCPLVAGIVVVESLLKFPDVIYTIGEDRRSENRPMGKQPAGNCGNERNRNRYGKYCLAYILGLF